MSVEDVLQNINTILDEYEHKHGLPHIQSPGEESELNIYLNMPREYISKLSIEDLGEIIVRLNQFAFYIQRLSNYEQATLTGAEIYLRTLTASKLSDYGDYVKYEVKVQLISKEDSAVQKLMQIIRQIKQRLDRLHTLSYNIRNIAEALLSVQRGKIHMSNITR